MGGPRHAIWWCVALCGWLALFFGPSAWQPSGAARPSVPQLTVAQASTTFASVWPKFDSAFVQGQLSLLSKYSTSSLLEAASGATGCGCAWTTPHSKVEFSIPVETSYPISFLAQLSTPAPKESIFSPYVTLVVITKANASSRWLVAYLVRFAGDQGFLKSSLVQAAPEATFPINQVVSQLAQFFTSIANTGSPPADDTWPQTGSTGQEVQDYLDTKASVEQQGGQQETTFTPLDTSVAFAYPNGDIMCGNYRSVSTVTAPANAPLVQPSDQITWGSQLAPGTYTSFTKFGMHQVCYSVNTVANAKTDKVSPISFFESVYEESGTPTP